MANHVFNLPNEGDIIFYKMRSSDKPLHPDKEWKGKVIIVIQEIDRPDTRFAVQLLEDGYEGLFELVSLSQIVEIATWEDETPCS